MRELAKAFVLKYGFLYLQMTAELIEILIAGSAFQHLRGYLSVSVARKLHTTMGLSAVLMGLLSRSQTATLCPSMSYYDREMKVWSIAKLIVLSIGVLYSRINSQSFRKTFVKPTWPTMMHHKRSYLELGEQFRPR